MRSDVMAFHPVMSAAGAVSLFEFGCRDCLVLEDLQGRGMDVTGFEPGAEAGRAGDFVSVYPYFDGDLPGIPDGYYDVAMAIGSLDRFKDEERALRVLREIRRAARLFLVLGLEEPGVHSARVREEALRLGTVKLERVRTGTRVILIDLCSSST